MITSLDLERINDLLIKTSMLGKIDSLENKLKSAEVIQSQNTPTNLVTMNSKLDVQDLTLNVSYNLTLVYQFSPANASQASVLAPLGTALLGMKLHETSVYQLRDGSKREIKVNRILFQPEAHGMFHL